MVLLILSASLAFFVNISTYFVIGNTSPITYNVVGHFKTCVVVVGGYVLFDYPLELKNSCGVILTLFGVILYSFFKLR